MTSPLPVFLSLFTLQLSCCLPFRIQNMQIPSLLRAVATVFPVAQNILVSCPLTGFKKPCSHQPLILLSFIHLILYHQLMSAWFTLFIGGLSTLPLNVNEGRYI